MKKWYSIILLASFLTGILQPILPMAEYHLFKGDIRDFAKADFSLCTAMICDLPGHLTQADRPCACDQPDDPVNPVLLDIEYYPIPVQATGAPFRLMLPDRGLLETGYLQNLPELYLFRDYPPPRIFLFGLA